MLAIVGIMMRAPHGAPRAPAPVDPSVAPAASRCAEFKACGTCTDQPECSYCPDTHQCFATAQTDVAKACRNGSTPFSEGCPAMNDHEWRDYYVSKGGVVVTAGNSKECIKTTGYHSAKCGESCYLVNKETHYGACAQWPPPGRPPPHCVAHTL